MNPLLDPDRRIVIAHRGASAEAPENTLEAFRLAAEQGCDAFELDLRVTRDGVPVVLHDPTLERTTDRAGAVAELGLAAAQAADAGAGYQASDGSRPWRGRGVRIPTLAEVLRAFPDMPLLIEIKARAAQHPVARVLEREGAAARSVVAAFDRRALAAFRRAPFQVGASRWDILRLVLLTRLGLRPGAPSCRLYAVPDRWRGRIEVPIPALVMAARRQGAPVHVWTVDAPDRARELWARGVSGIVTNRPGAIRAERDGRCGPSTPGPRSASA